MNILTDILSLFKRKKFVSKADPRDVVVLGINEEPEIEGIASPVPYKNAKLIKVKDLISGSDSTFENLPIGDLNAGCFKDKTTDPITGNPVVNFRRLKSLSLDLTIEENGDFIEFDLLSNKSTILLTQNFSSLLNKFSTGTDIFSIGRQAGIPGADVSSPFIGYSSNDHAKVDTFVIDTRKLVGISYASPVDVLSGEGLSIQIVAQSNITGVVLNWKLYKLDPDDLGNGGISGTTLTQITGASNLNLNTDLTSGGISTYGKEIIYDVTLGGSSIINKGDLLFLGWSYDSISIDPSDFLNISATIRS
jgi:hypothetical protein